MQDEIWRLTEAGVRATNRKIRWRERFIATWLPLRLQPGYEYRRK